MFQYRYIVLNGSETGVLDRKETQKERGARVTGGAKEAERALDHEALELLHVFDELLAVALHARLESFDMKRRASFCRNN